MGLDLTSGLRAPALSGLLERALIGSPRFGTPFRQSQNRPHLERRTTDGGTSEAHRVRTVCAGPLAAPGQSGVILKRCSATRLPDRSAMALQLSHLALNYSINMIVASSAVAGQVMMSTRGRDSLQLAL